MRKKRKIGKYNGMMKKKKQAKFEQLISKRDEGNE